MNRFDYEMSEDQRAAIDTLVAVAKTYFPSTQPAPAFPREEVAKAIDKEGWLLNPDHPDETVRQWSTERRAASLARADAIDALLQGKQP